MAQDDWGDFNGSGAALAESILPALLQPAAQRRLVPPVPAPNNTVPLPPAPLIPGAAAPPPGFLAGNLGGRETTPGGPVAGAPIQTGPSEFVNGGMRISPVSSPASRPGASNGPLDALREQMGVINQLVGAAPQQPVVRDQLTAGSSTAGLLNLNNGRMVGDQNLGQIAAHQGDIANLQSYNQAQAGRGQDIGQLLGRLGQMGSQALGAGDLALRTHQAIGPGGSMESNSAGRLHDQQLATAYMQGEAAHIAAGGSPESFARQWAEQNRPVPQFLQNRPTAAANPLAGGTGTPHPTATGEHGAVNPPTPAQTPSSRMEEVLRNVTRRQLGNTPGQTQRQWDATTGPGGITDFVNTLGSRFVQENTPEVMRLIIDRFGAPVADSWFTSRTSRLGRQTPQEQAIRMIQDSANSRVPGTVGSSPSNPQSPGPAQLIPWANPRQGPMGLGVSGG